jgi:hypothetical protein
MKSRVRDRERDAERLREIGRWRPILGWINAGEAATRRDSETRATARPGSETRDPLNPRGDPVLHVHFPVTFPANSGGCVMKILGVISCNL